MDRLAKGFPTSNSRFVFLTKDNDSKTASQVQFETLFPHSFFSTELLWMQTAREKKKRYQLPQK